MKMKCTPRRTKGNNGALDLASQEENSDDDVQITGIVAPTLPPLKRKLGDSVIHDLSVTTQPGHKGDGCKKKVTCEESKPTGLLHLQYSRENGSSGLGEDGSKCILRGGFSMRVRDSEDCRARTQFIRKEDNVGNNVGIGDYEKIGDTLPYSYIQGHEDRVGNELTQINVQSENGNSVRVDGIEQGEGNVVTDSLCVERPRFVPICRGGESDEDFITCTQADRTLVNDDDVDDDNDDDGGFNFLDNECLRIRDLRKEASADGTRTMEAECLKEVEGEQMEIPCTAMRALFDEAEHDYRCLGYGDAQRDECEDDLVICTQVEKDPKFSTTKYMQSGAARKPNIYDILISNNWKDSSTEANPNFTYEIHHNPAEGMGISGITAGALVDESIIDNHQGLEFNHDGATENMGSIECPICGVAMGNLPVSDREQHVNHCLEKGDSELRIPEDVLQPPAFESEGAEITECLQLLDSEDDDASYTATLQCPICGVGIDQLSTDDREWHTNACLDSAKDEELGEVAQDLLQASEGADMAPVVEWLRNLNLGKYVDIFLREEIDWDTLKWLTEEDLCSLGIVAFGPRRKIVCAIQELKMKEASTREPAPGSSTMQEPPGPSNPRALSSASVEINQGTNKSITDFFILPPNSRQRLHTLDHGSLVGPKPPDNVVSKAASAKSKTKRRPGAGGMIQNSIRASTISPWMCIPGTSFRVDAFKHLTGECSTWFLTHFHTDHKHLFMNKTVLQVVSFKQLAQVLSRGQLCLSARRLYCFADYQGLTRGFRHGKIFCSSITARRVNLRIGVPWDRLQIIPLDETVLIDGVRVTFIDANHCPGSVMILFEPLNGKAVLHTGDFRFCSDMTKHEALRASKITTLILDTTYCDPQYDFPKQEAVVQFVIDAIQAEAFNPKTLFLIGTYTIGKERIFLEVGNFLQKYIYVGAVKRRLLDCMDLSEEDKKWLTIKDQESHIHVVPLWSIASFKRMSSISRHYHGRYNSIVGFSPTGWTFGRDKKRIPGRPGRRYQQGTIIRYEVPYSEHCSFTELKEFVQAITPENIVPSVVSSSGQPADVMVAALLNKEPLPTVDPKETTETTRTMAS